jgi:hypothetical protein
MSCVPAMMTLESKATVTNRPRETPHAPRDPGEGNVFSLEQPPKRVA